MGAAQSQQAEPRTRFDLAAVLRAEDQLIGSCGLTVSNPASRQGWVEYCFNRTYWRHGYATEAVRAILALGFQELDLHRVVATCDPRNVGSWRVLAKAGMRREGHLLEERWQKGEWRDSYLYAILERGG